MRNWELAELWRWMADFMQMEGEPGRRVQAMRDGARWIGESEDPLVDARMDESAAAVPTAGMAFPPMPFEYVEVGVPDEEAVPV